MIRKLQYLHVVITAKAFIKYEYILNLSAAVSIVSFNFSNNNNLMLRSDFN